MNPITHITMDTAHYFDGALIAHGWKNSDPDRVERLYRQLVNITQLPAGYEIAISVATPEMERAGRATGVNAAWSYAACYRSMLDAQPRDPVPCTPVEGSPIGYIPAWAAAQMSDQGGRHRGWGVNTQIYREQMDGYIPVYLARRASQVSAGAPVDMTAAVDRAMVEMANISPPLRRSDCARLIRAAIVHASEGHALASAAVERDEEGRSNWTFKQWYEHVGAWETPEGWIAFGSPMAVRAMLIQYCRAAQLADSNGEVHANLEPVRKGLRAALAAMQKTE